jgi:hypothetical protein
VKITAEPRSDQWNADDFAGGPRTFTIAGVVPGKAEQKYDIQLVEGEGRVWRPPLTMLRVLVAAWTDEAETWKGRRVTLYTDPTIRFGRDVVGGIRISHLSGIDKPLQIASTVTRGKRATLTVQPLPDAPPAEDRAKTAITALTNAPSIPELDKLWGRVVSGGLDSIPAVKAAFDARAEELAASQ